MTEEFSFDVFLSHSSKDKAVVRPLAERLRADGLRVWFDEWEIRHGDSIPAKIEEGLERSRVLVLCMSANAFGSDWAQLESGTFRFRDPLNTQRRFIPLRIDETVVKGAIGQLFDIKWHQDDPKPGYSRLLEACQPTPELAYSETKGAEEGRVILAHNNVICGVGVSVDGKWVLADGIGKRPMRIRFNSSTSLPNEGSSRRDAESSPRLRNLAICPDGVHALTCAPSSGVNIWRLDDMMLVGKLVGPFSLPIKPTAVVDVSPDGAIVAAGSYNGTVTVWDFETREYIVHAGQPGGAIKALAVTPGGKVVFSGPGVGLHELNPKSEPGRRLFELDANFEVTAIAVTSDGASIVGAVSDNTIRIWDGERRVQKAVLEGHTGRILSLAVSRDGRTIVSGGYDRTVRIWDLESGVCISTLRGHNKSVRSVRLSPDDSFIVSGSFDGTVRVWPKAREGLGAVAKATQYTNAKVLLVGDSGVGKTGLSRRLASDVWEPSDSTVGAWATQWKLPVATDNGIEREIWLWDFGGQADQRLIHQLYMDETALAVLVFDGQKEDPFDTLGQWDRDLTRASRKAFAKLLVSGRVDAGGLRVSRTEVEKFVAERDFYGFLETSAKTNQGCDELSRAILDAIPWDELPCRTSEVLFKRLKEEIIRLKDEGRVLMRFNELREALQLRLSDELLRFANDELRAVLTLLAGPCVVWELSFGSLVLLQPERINAYAQAVIRTLQADTQQRGCLMEERVLKGDLMYESSMERLEGDDERFVLLAMHQTLVERGLCIRQSTTQGNLLVFPSYYRKERPDLVQYPAVQVNYRFTGFLDELYSTLVVRLHHSDTFQQDALWRYAADFKTNAGKQLGIKLTRLAQGVGDLDVYFDTTVSVEEKIIFSKYVHEHLLHHAQHVERLRHYVCPACGTPVGNRDIAMKRLNEWLHGRPPQTDVSRIKKKEEMPTIVCVECEQRVPLWDEMEERFASPEIQQQVREMQEEAKVELDNESKERALVGEVITTVALAAQLCREKNVSDHGIDMEIEFKDDTNEATNRYVFLQLKSGDSYLRKSKKDGTEVFNIKKQRQAKYWMASPFPVLLVIRDAEGEVRWMEVRDYLKQLSENGTKPVKQIVFKGERFDVMSVRRWRDRVLSDSALAES